MLRLDPNLTFDARARIALGGLTADFGVRCRLLDVEQLERLQEQQASGAIDSREFIAAWLVGWAEGEVCDADGTPLPFTPGNLDALLRMPGAAVALVRAFYSGYDEATEGNSAPLRGAS